MKSNRLALFRALAVLPLAVLTGSAISQPATISWPEAVAQLTGERAKAETCVALIKKYGDDAQIARGQLTYTTAKADSDALIAGLITALATGQAPLSLSSLQTKLNSGVSGLVEFCRTVSNLLPRSPRFASWEQYGHGPRGFAGRRPLLCRGRSAPSFIGARR